jgi:hypothetical protein
MVAILVAEVWNNFKTARGEALLYSARSISNLRSNTCMACAYEMAKPVTWGLVPILTIRISPLISLVII